MGNVFEYKEEYGWLTNICLNVTDACNLACRYCFVEQHPHYMTLDVAKQAVHFILDNLEKKNKKFGNNEKASITFFGGEPMLMWTEIIVPLTNYIKNNNYPIELSITTNGTLLNKERIKFFKENNFSMLLSADGNEYTQNYNRPCQNKNLQSFKLLEDNIPLILEAFPDITLRMTAYAPTIQETFNNYMYAIEKGFNNVFIAPDIRHEWTEEQITIMQQELDKIFMFITQCYLNEVNPIGFTTIDRMFKALIILSQGEKEIDISRSCHRCGLGTTFGSIGYDGSIYGCQEQASQEKNIFYIGNLSNGIDKNLHSRLLSTYSQKQRTVSNNINKCNKCSLRKICVGWTCPSTSWDLFHNFHVDSEIACLWREKICANCLVLSTILQDNQLFKDYFERKVLKS